VIVRGFDVAGAGLGSSPRHFADLESTVAAPTTEGQGTAVTMRTWVF
jgi:hypothetical protein